jgi:hypothetical protein
VLEEGTKQKESRLKDIKRSKKEKRLREAERQQGKKRETKEQENA